MTFIYGIGLLLNAASFVATGDAMAFFLLIIGLRVYLDYIFNIKCSPFMNRVDFVLFLFALVMVAKAII